MMEHTNHLAKKLPKNSVNELVSWSIIHFFLKANHKGVKLFCQENVLKGNILFYLCQHIGKDFIQVTFVYFIH